MTNQKRKFNFYAGPAVLPVEVLEEAAQGLVDFEGSGLGIAEISHRSESFTKVMEGTKNGLREIMGVPSDYEILILQGGATLQFSMLAMNLLEKRGDYINTGIWAEKAFSEAGKIGKVQEIASSKDLKFSCIPEKVKQEPGADYLHVTSNNTVEGTQFHSLPEPVGCPLVIDASSDIMSRPMSFRNVGLVYAGAQKNLGPSGVVVVIIRKDLAEKTPRPLPGFLRYSTHVKAGSLSNTPCTIGVYILKLVMEWTKKQGGILEMARRNEKKASLVYDQIDTGTFYKGLAVKKDRSLMNVTFTLPGEELTERFLAGSKELRMVGLKGYRTMGGIRASLYNAMPVEGAQTLASFMKDFAKKHG